MILWNGKFFVVVHTESKPLHHRKKNTFEKTRATKCTYVHFILLQLNKVVELARALGELIVRGKIVCEALKSRLAHS